MVVNKGTGLGGEGGGKLDRLDPCDCTFRHSTE